jgi:hypothetical protein
MIECPAKSGAFAAPPSFIAIGSAFWSLVIG